MDLLEVNECSLFSTHLACAYVVARNNFVHATATKARELDTSVTFESIPIVKAIVTTKGTECTTDKYDGVRQAAARAREPRRRLSTVAAAREKYPPRPSLLSHCVIIASRALQCGDTFEGL